MFIVWEIVVLLFSIPKFILPAPTDIWASLLQWHQAIWTHALQTLYTTLVGFGLAVVFGLVLGWLVGYSAIMYSALYPLLIGFNSVPKVALVPLLVIWFGIGTVPAILTAFLIAFFPIVVNVATGLATLEPELQDVLRSLGANKWEIFVKWGCPALCPISLPP
jgi:NitT/TauT family transport system permease protein